VGSIFFLFLIQKFVVFVVEIVAVYVDQFERLRADDFILGAAFITGDNVALFHFIYFQIERVFALRAIGHVASFFECTAYAL
jgi:hypothetical protein